MKNLSKTLLVLCLWLLAIATVIFKLNLVTVLALLAILLIAHWFQILFTIKSSPAKVLRLETISGSHFVEKVRWSLDRLGVNYKETPHAGTLGVFFKGRTVPRLHIPTGLVTSTIGNSSDILRYLWGRYSADPEFEARAQFLEPSAESLALEQEMDAYGVDLQKWFYAHGLAHKRFIMRVWGLHDPRIARWQRFTIWLIFPLLRFLMRNAFRIGRQTHSRSGAKIEVFLAKMETLLQDGRQYLLNSDTTTYVDITFAALSGVWVFPSQYGNGRADNVIPDLNLFPPSMYQDMQRWQETYPKVDAFIRQLYQTQRANTDIAT